ncbi:hypothetical protein L596_021380 [Steinernema carpocapsae]|uniref:Uncharacterized protein n=1 Tax=Steinernema carpocapsae TaxID=34508 RepID=A0A4U5MIJ2_STECR|nr:hypothetical protein L596_021380 [Steinernema carpocapsae]
MCPIFTKKRFLFKSAKEKSENAKKRNDSPAYDLCQPSHTEVNTSSQQRTSAELAESSKKKTRKPSVERTQGSSEAMERVNSDQRGRKKEKHEKRVGSKKSSEKGTSTSKKPSKYCVDEPVISTDTTLSEFDRKKPVTKEALKTLVPVPRNDPTNDTISVVDFSDSTQIAKTKSPQIPQISQNHAPLSAPAPHKPFIFIRSETVDAPEHSAKDESFKGRNSRQAPMSPCPTQTTPARTPNARTPRNRKSR